MGSALKKAVSVGNEGHSHRQDRKETLLKKSVDGTDKQTVAAGYKHPTQVQTLWHVQLALIAVYTVKVFRCFVDHRQLC